MAVRRPVQAAEHVHHRGFARAARAHDGHEFAVLDLQRHTAHGMHIHFAGVVNLVNLFEFDDERSFWFRFLMFCTTSHVTSAASAHTIAPIATVLAARPAQCESAPASIPPMGIMPPKTSAQMPITRPRISSEAPICNSVFVVEKNSSIPQPPIPSNTNAT